MLPNQALGPWTQQARADWGGTDNHLENIERLDPRSAPAACTKPRQGSADYSIKGRLDLDSLALVVNSRSADRSPLLDVSKAGIVDERCGKTALAPADSLNYYVTPAHYWGEDILQLPKSAATGRVYVDGNLHLCQYDGDWSVSCARAARTFHFSS